MLCHWLYECVPWARLQEKDVAPLLSPGCRAFGKEVDVDNESMKGLNYKVIKNRSG